MIAPFPDDSMRAFFARLRAAPRGLLMLDYDGTLAPFQVDRMAAKPAPVLLPMLRPLFASTRTRTVLVSGRPVAELLQLLPPLPIPELWGAHGGERLRPGGSLESAMLAPEALDSLTGVWARVVASPWATRAEQKPYSVALHDRGMGTDDRAALAAWAREAARAIAPSDGVEYHSFDGGHEFRAAWVDKSVPVRTLLDEESDAVAAYCGDDLTDEDAFKALGQRGLPVLVRAERRHDSASGLCLRSHEELAAWLQLWIEARGD